MGPYLMRFHIRDLEQFTGVKAHTIRVWERRYGLLKPDRTDTNIRTYDLDELKTILNVAYLNQHGHKISRIAAMTEHQREQLVRNSVMTERDPEGILDSLVLAMLSFDEAMFDRLCAGYEREHGFRSLVEQVYKQLLVRIGILWQSSAICPAQEHFISNLIRQRLIVAAAQQPAPTDAGPLHVLYLPEDEIHELGLLYVNYLLRSLGKRTVYLGQSVPRSDLGQIASIHSGDIVFISFFVVQPEPEKVPEYLKGLRSMLPSSRFTFLFTGGMLRDLPEESIPYGMDLRYDLVGAIAAIDSFAS